VDAAVARIARLAGRRALEAVPLLLAVSAIAFGLLQLVPGGPLEVYLSNPGVRPEDLDRLRRALGLDRPVWVQYLSWLTAFARGDWGYSFSDGRPVLDRVIERLPASLELLAASLALALAAALPAGILAAVRKRTWVDRAVTAVAAAGISIPTFWMGLMLQLVFAIGLGWLPSSGRGPDDSGLLLRLQHLAMPAAVLALVHGAAWSRYLRASLVEALDGLFVAAARARGVPRRDRLLRHALPNALAPVVTVVLLDAALLVPGAVVTESVFAWPGVGSLFTEALGRRDYTVLMAMLMVSSLAVIVFNLLADVVHAWLDPRVSA
jgi:peptide/nickel transport system permease protein